MEFEILIQGRGGHGSRPDHCSNPVYCFTAVYTALQPLGCRFRWVDGGTSANIIPDTLSFAVLCDASCWEALEQSVKNVCKNYNCSPVLQKKGE